MKKNKLFDPLELRSVTLNNRIAVSPMCMYSSQDGFSNQWHVVHLGSRAVGGAGLVFTEATAVSPEGRISPEDLGIWKDEHIIGLQEITRFVEEQGSTPGIQLAHAGRKASTASPWKGREIVSKDVGGWLPMAPSAIPFRQGDPVPQEMDKTAIKQVIEDFSAAAKRAFSAGFKILEIHAAHGYLLHEFLSPLSNRREDSYGGTFENRCRIILEVVDAVRAVWPDYLPLFLRISATDWVEGGWNENESIALAKIVKKKGVDLMDCSSGGLVPDAKIPAEKGYQLGFAENIRAQSGIATGAVGLITTPGEAEGIIQTGKADVVFLGREFLRNPYFPMQAAKALGAELSWPVQYERADS